MILNGERPRAAPDEGNDQDNYHTHTGLESRPTRPPTQRYTNENRNDLQNGKKKAKTSDCRLFFSYRAHKKLHKVGSVRVSRSSRVSYGMECVFFFSRTLTSSKVEVRCVFVGSNSLRQNCVPVLFDKLLSDIFSREWIVESAESDSLSERDIRELIPMFHRSVVLDCSVLHTVYAAVLARKLLNFCQEF